MPSSRYDAVDALRGLAILAMIVFHFSWDLSYFGLADIRITSDPFWVWFARIIAGTILVVMGISFAMALERGVRARPFLIRLAKVGGCAALISLGTYQLLGPGNFIYFGILHHIALASLVLLVIGRLQSWFLLVLGGVFLAGPHWLFSDFFSAPWLAWLGLWWPIGMPADYVPVFPWLALPVWGLILGRVLMQRPILLTWHGEGAVSGLCRFAGRHSLLIYMLHQPVLFGSLYLMVTYIL